MSRIFKMRQQPGQLVWKSDLALAEREWEYLKGVFAHQRLRPLLQHGRRVLQPLPGVFVSFTYFVLSYLFVVIILFYLFYFI